MIFAAINWLNISISLLLIAFVIVCLLMALLVLMQRPKQEGLGAAFGGGVTDQVFGARTTNVLQKGTVYLGSLFFLLSLTLAILIGKQNKQKSLLEPETPVAEVEVQEAPTMPEAPVAPAPTTTSLADELPVEETPVTEESSAVEESTPEEAQEDAQEDAIESTEAAPAETPESSSETPAEETSPTDKTE